MQNYCPSHFTVSIVRFFSCKSNFVSFKLDIFQLRYCHLSEPISFLLGQSSESELHWWNRTTDKQGKCEVYKQVWTMGLGRSNVTKKFYLRPVLKRRPKSKGLEESSKYDYSTTTASIYLRSACVYGSKLL